MEIGLRACLLIRGSADVVTAGVMEKTCTFTMIAAPSCARSARTVAVGRNPPSPSSGLGVWLSTTLITRPSRDRHPQGVRHQVQDGRARHHQGRPRVVSEPGQGAQKRQRRRPLQGSAQRQQGPHACQDRRGLSLLPTHYAPRADRDCRPRAWLVRWGSRTKDDSGCRGRLGRAMRLLAALRIWNWEYEIGIGRRTKSSL